MEGRQRSRNRDREAVEGLTGSAEKPLHSAPHGPPPRAGEDLLQWRKWRIPVNTIAKPASSAAAITSSSRIEPPGWITAVAPASTAVSSPSAKGKKASEATAEPLVLGWFHPARSAASFAFQAAMRADSTRFI